MKNSILSRIRKKRQAEAAKAPAPASAPAVNSSVLASLTKRAATNPKPTIEEVKEYGIKETSDVVVFVTAGVSAAMKASEDGLGLNDLTVALGLMDEGVAAFRGLSEVDDEIRDLDGDELAELTALVSSRLQIENATASKIIPSVLGMAPSLLGLIRVLMSLRESDDEPEAVAD